MLLVLTNSRDATTDYLAAELDRISEPYIRLDTDRLAAEVALGFEANSHRLTVDGRAIVPSVVSNVWLRRPEPILTADAQHGPAQTPVASEWSEALEGFLSEIPQERWMNHPSANARASQKTEQLRRAAQFGLRVPRTIVTQSEQRLRRFWRECDGRVVVKPLSSGHVQESNGDRKIIYTSLVEKRHLQSSSRLATCPSLFQEQIGKFIDVRICIIDDFFHAVGLRSLDGGPQVLDIRRDNMSRVIHGEISVPDSIRIRLMKLVRSYGLRFAAVDMAIDRRDDWCFFEINPNGQWAWLDLVGATRIADSFVKAFSRMDISHRG